MLLNGDLVGERGAGARLAVHHDAVRRVVAHDDLAGALHGHGSAHEEVSAEVGLIIDFEGAVIGDRPLPGFWVIRIQLKDGAGADRDSVEHAVVEAAIVLDRSGAGGGESSAFNGGRIRGAAEDDYRRTGIGVDSAACVGVGSAG